ncbi:2,3,4,5-tetrahydropyridine-2,6-dicarboxylate N-succinyltransferase [Stagnimonas aquatica]|uniref:2,3,4,5-tetrahydropyridine-2,6-dicarboxylate N-succinyltransferase n=1 Tax=Stagnimonas aquatica TaxID=2689987 RepID=A0A3N0VDY7_9GAMM|nr:2,3,4,5-tetrahydropyridine-2,6-dicarboxylate N-succinyltransferase [Stagnimonas aquatica]ROH90993.1 2,3,4,5-tetrahydropyridine-2,6-dicarboxylate N-succinyltransferase [Stagnimonas aquatica]
MTDRTLQTTIESAWDNRDQLDRNDPAIRDAVAAAIEALDSGRARVAEPGAEGWKVNEWLKKAVLLYFRLHDNAPIAMGALSGYDKVPLKFAGWSEAQFKTQGARVVPPAAVRKGAYIAPGAILMPSYVNIGAYVGKGTMVDTWATVGSCAQIGANVHLSGGVGIGGVLEPLQAAPTIIEDDCFIGARSEVVEGVVVEKGAVLSMGVFIGQSTPIYDRATGEISYGRVPSYSVVVPGSLPRDGGRYNLTCAVIVKRVDAQTRAKTGINALLRDD